MNKAFLAKYGSYTELTKMALKSPGRKNPNKLELKAAKMLGEEWEYVGDGRLEIGGLIPDFVHKTKPQVLEVLGCYFHSCPIHFSEVKRPRSASPSYKQSVFKRNGYEVIFIWEHDIKQKGALAFKMAGV
jgi:G:T-mismatch repair DNA endonuclease (very short patch repair protein)